MKYWLSLPPEWKPEGKWPILVTADGAGKNWRGACVRTMRQRTRVKVPFIVVSIVRLNPKDYGEELLQAARRAESVDDWFDMKGLRTVTSEVAEELSGEGRFYLTGFSAGGAVTWYATIYHPEWLAASAPACGGFGLRSAPGEKLVTEAPERKTLPIRVFIGVEDKLALRQLAGDEEAIRKHWEPYRDSFARQGFENVKLVLLPGVAHSPCTAQVADFFAEVHQAR
jgi:predicted peptidase